MGTIVQLAILAAIVGVLYLVFMGVTETESDTERALGYVFIVGLIVVIIVSFMNAS